jgi:hypothetical protein
MDGSAIVANRHDKPSSGRTGGGCLGVLNWLYNQPWFCLASSSGMIESLTIQTSLLHSPGSREEGMAFCAAVCMPPWSEEGRRFLR